MSASAITTALVEEVNFRLFDECVPRIQNCLDRLTEDQVWWRPNSASNSIGNLVLHLCGNVRQWIVSGVGEQTDVRRRSEEFSEEGPLPKDKLIALPRSVGTGCTECVGRGYTSDDLLVVKPVQVYRAYH
ncbi:MAG: DUF1572 family protein [Saprospiraceae bacterium]